MSMKFIITESYIGQENESHFKILNAIVKSG